MTMDSGNWISLAGLILAAGGAVTAYLRSRENQLRRMDVLHWAIACISLLRSVQVRLASNSDDAPLDEAAVIDAQADLSALIDHGRLFFRNVNPGSGRPQDHGLEKNPAYQGFRPMILDPLVAVFDGLELVRGPFATRRNEIASAVDCATRDFVSLAQSEVGRSRAASKIASEAGYGAPIDRYLRRM